MILEAERIGHGASGRNGGWISSKLAGLERTYERTKRIDASDASELRAATRRSVTEILEIFESSGHDIEAAQDGFMVVANLPSEAQRLRQQTEAERSRDPHSGTELLEKEEARELLRVDSTQAATFNPNGAVVNPAKLVYALADLVETMGGEIFESTRVTQVASGSVTTEHGKVSCDHVVLATEGYGQGVGRNPRMITPIMSSMIITDPLPNDYWESVGWLNRRGVCGSGHRYFYSQRTVDNRLALGGRGLPYKFGSGLDKNGEVGAATVQQLRNIMGKALGVGSEHRLAQAWCGMLGVPRDWSPSVTFDEATRIGSICGFVGQGLTATFLAAGSLADLILQKQTRRTRYPWVGRKTRNWEPEPLRFAGAYAVYSLYQLADLEEQTLRRRSTSAFAKVADWLGGRT